METANVPEPVARSQREPWPPATPPEPPMTAQPSHDSEGREPLTSVPWSVGAATLFVLAMIAVTVLAAFAADALRRLPLDDLALTLTLGALLGGAYLLVIGAAWVVAAAADSPFAAAYGLRPTSTGTLVGAAIFATLAGRLAAGIWGALIEYLGIEVTGRDIDPSKLFPSGAFGIAMTVLVAGVLAPVAEEIVFRGVLLSALDRRWGTGFAIVMSSAIFSLLHVTPFAVPPIFVFALLLGWLFVRTRSLTVCIVAHASFNLTGLAALYALKAAGLM